MMFLCWLFRGNDFDRNKVMTYRPEHVRTLAAMLRRHGGHDLVCVSDMSVPGVRVVPMPDAVAAPPATARAIFTCGPYRPDTLIDLEWVRADYHD